VSPKSGFVRWCKNLFFLFFFQSFQRISPLESVLDIWLFFFRVEWTKPDLGDTSCVRLHGNVTL
jgi:hypothetical protein